MSPNEFVAFNPVLNSYTLLTPCPATAQVVAACVTPNGLGFYCRDNGGKLFYYNIATTTWTTITSTYFDQSATDITATISGVSTGGDMAFDNSGNLYMLFSNSSKYGLYKLPAAVPTTTQASITLTQIMAPTTATPDGSIIAGIAFSNTGQIYMSTINNNLYILNNNLTTTLQGALTTPLVGIDLTSCNFPLGVLPVNFVSFTANLYSNNQVNLNWTVAQKGNTQVYQIQESQDGAKWQNVGSIPSNNFQSVQSYSYNRFMAQAGNHFYRICEIDINGQVYYSETRMVKTGNSSSISFWPNPASNNLMIQNSQAKAVKLRIFDPLGRSVQEHTIQPGTYTIDISGLPKSTYMISVLNNEESLSMKFIKE